MRKIITLDGVTYMLLVDWAWLHRISPGIARGWAEGGLLEKARRPPLKRRPWIIPEKTKVPEAVVLLGYAKKLFQPKFTSAIIDYEQDPGNRARWSKEEVMAACQWPYPSRWRVLRKILERDVGLIGLAYGSRKGWGGVIKYWTFATCVEDLEMIVIHAARSQVGVMKRTATVTSLAIAPPDERYALDEESKTRIDKVLDEQGLKLDKVLKTLRDVKQNLVDRDTMKLLAEFGDPRQDENDDE